MTNNLNDSNIGYKPGDMISKYQVVSTLGAGGQAIVYKCFDPALDRHVAIKQVAPNLAANPAYLNQLRKTVQTIAKLGQKNEAIITVHELIENQDGFFYVMEFVEGHTLEFLIQEADGPIEVKAMLLILFRMASALHEIHSAGIIHRDIKPNNIILTPGLRPKIIDFGVASLPDSDLSMPLATTKYLAPELYAGDAPTGAADIYSLGFLAYEMLIGREKFNEIFADIVKDKHSEALRWMKWHGNPAVSAPEPCAVNPTIPKALSDIIAKMIIKDPAQRINSTEELGKLIKKSFSPKAKKSAPTSSASRVPAGVSPYSKPATASASMNQLKRPVGLGSLEGDEVDYTPPGQLSSAGSTAGSAPTLQAPAEFNTLPTDPGLATAQVPREPISKRTKIIAAAVAAVLLIGIIGFFINKRNTENRKVLVQRQLVTKAFDDAVKSFEDKKYSNSISEFTSLLSNQPAKKFIGAKKLQTAKIYRHIAQAHLDIRNGLYAGAKQNCNDAENIIQDLRDSIPMENAKAHEKLDKFEDLVRQVDVLRENKSNFKNFQKKFLEQIRLAKSPNDFDSVETQISNTIQNKELNFSASQINKFETMLKDIKRKRFEIVFATIMSQAKQASDPRDKLQKFKEAEEQFRPSVNPDCKAITATRKAELLRPIPGMRAAISHSAGKRTLLDNIEEATTNDEKIAALTAAIESGKFKGSTLRDLTDQKKQVLLSIDIEDARNKTANNQTLAAIDAWKKVLESDPDNMEAKTFLAEFEKSKQLTAIIESANKKYLAGQYLAAIADYEKALKIKADPELSQKIEDCKYEIAFAKAKSAASKRDYDTARENYEKAKLHRPSEAMKIDTIIEMLNSAEQYEKLLASAYESLSSKKYDDAISYFEKAQQIKNSDQITKGITLAQYRKMMVRARDKQEAGDLIMARILAKKAQKILKTDEVKAFIKELTAKIEKK